MNIQDLSTEKENTEALTAKQPQTAASENILNDEKKSVNSSSLDPSEAQVELSNQGKGEPFVYAPNFMHDANYALEHDNSTLKWIENIKHTHSHTLRARAMEMYEKKINMDLDIYRKQALYYLRKTEMAAKEYQIDPSPENENKLKAYTALSDSSHKELKTVSEYVYRDFEHTKQKIEAEKERFNQEYKGEKEATRERLLHNYGSEMIQDPVSFAKGLMRWMWSLGKQIKHSYEAGLKFADFASSLKLSKSMDDFHDVMDEYQKAKDKGLIDDDLLKLDLVDDNTRLLERKANNLLDSQKLLTQKDFEKKYLEYKANVDKEMKAISENKKLPYHDFEQNNEAVTAKAETGQEFIKANTITDKYIVSNNHNLIPGAVPVIDRNQNAIYLLIDEKTEGQKQEKYEVTNKELEDLKQKGSINNNDYKIMSGDELMEYRMTQEKARNKTAEIKKTPRIEQEQSIGRSR